MLETLQAKLISAGVMLVVLLLLLLASFVWGHHVGSTSQSESDAKKLTACTVQNVALAQAIKTDAATITGLKQANAEFAASAAANEADLKKSVAELTTKLAHNRAVDGKKQAELKGVVKNDKASSQWANLPVPPAILDILRQ